MKTITKFLAGSVLWFCIIPPAQAIQSGVYYTTSTIAPYHTAITGADASDNTSFVAVGDINGDRIKDIIMAASGGDGPGNTRSGSGEINIYYGEPDPPAALTTENHDVQLYAQASQLLGYWVTAGDLNNDHIDDVIFAHRYIIGGVTLSSTVYVLFGGPNIASSIDVTAALPSYITTIQTGQGAYWRHATIEDVNNDGTNDLILGQPYGLPSPGGQAGPVSRGAPGAVHVLLGQSNWPSSIDLTTETTMTHWSIFGAQGALNGGLGSLEDWTGHTTAAGDVVGDSTKEILIGSNYADGRNNGKPDVGEVAIVSGESTPNTFGFRYTASTWTANTIGLNYNPWAFNRFLGGGGVQVAIVAGTGSTPVQTRYITANSSSTLTVNANWTVMPDASSVFQIRCVDLLYGEQYLTMYGEGVGTAVNDKLGMALASADVNNDGLDDILAGAPHADSISTLEDNVGKVFVIFRTQNYLGPRADDADVFSATTIGDTIFNWTANRYIGAIVKIEGGTCSGLRRPIASNTNNTLTVSPAWNVAVSTWGVLSSPCTPDNTSDFRIAALDMVYDTANVVIQGVTGTGTSLGLCNTLHTVDVTGDNIPDILVGADHPTVVGEASFVIFGKTSLSGTILITQAEVQIYGGGGPQAGQAGGYHNLIGGDLNGDGKSNEMLVSHSFLGANKGQGLLFLDTRIPLTKVTVTLTTDRGTREYITSYRVTETGAVDKQVSNKVK